MRSPPLVGARLSAMANTTASARNPTSGSQKRFETHQATEPRVTGRGVSVPSSAPARTAWR